MSRCWAASSIWPGRRSSGWIWRSRTAAKRLVNLFFFGQYMLASLMAPSFAAGAITGEKERMSYEMLLATPLRPGAIVLGKLFAALCHLGILDDLLAADRDAVLAAGRRVAVRSVCGVFRDDLDGGAVRHDQLVGEQLFSADECVAGGVVPDDFAAGGRFACWCGTSWSSLGRRGCWSW